MCASGASACPAETSTLVLASRMGPGTHAHRGRKQRKLGPVSGGLGQRFPDEFGTSQTVTSSWVKREKIEGDSGEACLHYRI